MNILMRGGGQTGRPDRVEILRPQDTVPELKLPDGQPVESVYSMDNSKIAILVNEISNLQSSPEVNELDKAYYNKLLRFIQIVLDRRELSLDSLRTRVKALLDYNSSGQENTSRILRAPTLGRRQDSHAQGVGLGGSSVAPDTAVTSPTGGQQGAAQGKAETAESPIVSASEATQGDELDGTNPHAEDQLNAESSVLPKTEAASTISEPLVKSGQPSTSTEENPATTKPSVEHSPESLELYGEVCASRYKHRIYENMFTDANKERELFAWASQHSRSGQEVSGFNKFNFEVFLEGEGKERVPALANLFVKIEALKFLGGNLFMFKIFKDHQPSKELKEVLTKYGLDGLSIDHGEDTIKQKINLAIYMLQAEVCKLSLSDDPTKVENFLKDKFVELRPRAVDVVYAREVLDRSATLSEYFGSNDSLPEGVRETYRVKDKTELDMLRKKFLLEALLRLGVSTGLGGSNLQIELYSNLRKKVDSFVPNTEEQTEIKNDRAKKFEAELGSYIDSVLAVGGGDTVAQKIRFNMKLILNKVMESAGENGLAADEIRDALINVIKRIQEIGQVDETGRALWFDMIEESRVEGDIDKVRAVKNALGTALGIDMEELLKKKAEETSKESKGKEAAEVNKIKRFITDHFKSEHYPQGRRFQTFTSILIGHLLFSDLSKENIEKLIEMLKEYISSSEAIINDVKESINRCKAYTVNVERLNTPENQMKLEFIKTTYERILQEAIEKLGLQM